MNPAKGRTPPQLLKGFRDYLEQDARTLRWLSSQVEQVFSTFGFSPMTTPALEYAELLTGKYGPEADKLMYRFVDHGSREVAMRYDHTVPLARVLSMNQSLQLPLKRYVIAPVWRADKPQRGRLREFIQCDVDIVGSDQARADAEILAVAYTLLTRLGVKKFSLRINHRVVIQALVSQIEGIAPTQVGAVIRVIDRFPKLGEAESIKYLGEQGLTQEQIEQLLALLASDSGLRDEATKSLGVLRKLLKKNPEAQAALKELAAIVEHAHALGIPKDQLRYDVNVVRGLDYYTGLVVEAELSDLPLFGSVFGGGRYDTLIGAVAGRPVPAVGISLGLGRLFDALQELKAVPAVPPAARVVVAVLDDAPAEASEKAATALRTKGISSELYVGRPAKLDKQLAFASKRGADWLVWQGPKEARTGVYAAKHLPTRKQHELKLVELITLLADLR